MKKIILILAIFATFQTISAQKSKKKTTSSTYSSSGEGFSKSDIFISGSLGYTSKKVAGEAENSTGIAPSLGYFLTDNIALGARFGYTNTSSAGTSTGEFSVGVFGRYYTTPNSKFSLFAEAGVAYASDTSGESTSVKTITAGLKPGLNYFLNNHFAIEATLGQIGIVNTSSGNVSNTDANFGFDFANIGLGLNYKF